MTTYEQQKEEISQGLSSDCRVKLSQGANQVIETYQKAYKDNTGRKISKADVICKLIAYGASGLQEETHRHAVLAAERRASV